MRIGMTCNAIVARVAMPRLDPVYEAASREAVE
jgi:hypothetical protein